MEGSGTPLMKGTHVVGRDLGISMQKEGEGHLQ